MAVVYSSMEVLKQMERWDNRLYFLLSKTIMWEIRVIRTGMEMLQHRLQAIGDP